MVALLPHALGLLGSPCRAGEGAALRDGILLKMSWGDTVDTRGLLQASVGTLKGASAHFALERVIRVHVW